MAATPGGHLFVALPPQAAAALSKLQTLYPGIPHEEILQQSLEFMLAYGSRSDAGCFREAAVHPGAPLIISLRRAQLEVSQRSLSVALDQAGSMSRQLGSLQEELGRTHDELDAAHISWKDNQELVLSLQKELGEAQMRLHDCALSQLEAQERVTCLTRAKHTADRRIQRLHRSQRDKGFASAVAAGKRLREDENLLNRTCDDAGPPPSFQFPEDLLQVVAAQQSPQWQGVMRLVCKEMHKGVKKATRGKSRLNVADMCSSVELLTWAFWSGMPWDECVPYAAAKTGRLSVLQWAVQRGAPLTKSTPRYAIRAGHMAVLVWLASQDSCPKSEEALLTAAQCGVQWVKALDSHGWVPRNTSKMAYLAARSGRRDVILWLLSKEEKDSSGLPVNSVKSSFRPCVGAAEVGNVAELKWLRAEGFPWDWQTARAAAEGGHLTLLQWAISQGCNWTPSTCTAATKAGHLEVLKYANYCGCPGFDRAELLAVAHEYGQAHVQQWLMTVP